MDENRVPLLLLDNSTLAFILGNGDFRFTNLKFEEAKAIIDMNGEEGVIKCFTNPDIEMALKDYVGVEQSNFPYEETHEMLIGQDAVAVKLYIMPSGSQPIILGDNGQQAKKIRNAYVYCQHIVRLK